MQDIPTIFTIIILLFSVVIHEVAHGYAALRFGDQTAKLAGRLTLNPIKHLDMMGSIILPLMLVVLKAPFLIGWAKPVPYNPNNLSDYKKGTLWVASAGILANLALTVLFSGVIRLILSTGNVALMPFVQISSAIVLINIVLAIFNLMPIPPLDGSKILFSLLPVNTARKIERFMTKYSLVLLLTFLFFIWELVTPLIFVLFRSLTGIF